MGGVSRSNWVFAALAAVAVLLLIRILLPFLMPVLLGGFLVVLFQPLHQQLRQLAAPPSGAGRRAGDRHRGDGAPAPHRHRGLAGGTRAARRGGLRAGACSPTVSCTSSWPVSSPRDWSGWRRTIPRGEELELALLGAVEWNATFLRSLLGGSTALVAPPLPDGGGGLLLLPRRDAAAGRARAHRPPRSPPLPLLLRRVPAGGPGHHLRQRADRPGAGAGRLRRAVAGRRSATRWCGPWPW